MAQQEILSGSDVFWANEKDKINSNFTAKADASYPTVAAMVADTLLVGRVYATHGYYTSGDGGGALYLIKTAAAYAATPDGYIDHPASSDVAVLIAGKELDIRQAGATLIADSTAAFAAADAYAVQNNIKVWMPGGTFTVDSETWTPSDLNIFYGEGDIKDGDDWVAFGYGVPYPILGLGQSNEATNPSMTGGDLTLDPNVYLWDTDASSDPVIAGTVFNVAERGVAPLNIGTNTQSLFFHALKKLGEFRKQPMCGVMIAKGGVSIESLLSDAALAANGWTRPGAGQDLTLLMYPGAATALQSLPGQPTKYKVVQIDQGETGQSDAVETRALKLRVLWEEMTAAGIVDEETQFILDDIAYSVANTHLERQIATNSRVLLEIKSAKQVSSYGLDLSTVDGQHYTGQSCIEKGHRIAETIMSPRIFRDFWSEKIYCGVEWGLGSFTNVANSDEPHIAHRPPFSLTTFNNSGILFDKTNALIGACLSVPAGQALLAYTRRLIPVPPVGKVISVGYVIATDQATPSIVHQVAIKGFDRDRVLNYTSVGGAATLSTQNLPVFVITTIGRVGSGATKEVTAGVEFVAIGPNTGYGGTGDSHYVRLLFVNENDKL